MSSASAVMSVLNSVVPAMRRPTFIIPSRMSTGWPGSAASCSRTKASAAATISGASFARCCRWKAGCISRRCRSQKSPSLVSTPLPASRPTVLVEEVGLAVVLVVLLQDVLDGVGVGQQVDVDAGEGPDADVVAVLPVRLRVQAERVALELPQAAQQPVSPRTRELLPGWRACARDSSPFRVQHCDPFRLLSSAQLYPSFGNLTRLLGHGGDRINPVAVELEKQRRGPIVLQTELQCRPSARKMADCRESLESLSTAQRGRHS